ncbi:MAG: ribonuclease R [Schwartzia sp.]|nr:ribonuclease R [Schwartzia sp. (in: firmicutes)]
METEMQEKIISYMRDTVRRPITAEALAEELEIGGAALEPFFEALSELEKTAAVIRNRSGLYGLPERMNLVVGKLSMSGKGYGFIIPDVRQKETDTDVFVPGAMLASAMNGDRVVARVTPSPIPGRAREGEIIRIVERANTKIVGTFASSKSFGFVTPDDQKIGQDIFIPKKSFGGAKTGMKVVAEITKWPEGRHSAEGAVVELLGRAGDPGVDVLSVMRQYDLVQEFPRDVQAEADRVPQKVKPDEYRGRRDRRDRRALSVVTVDGDDSKDFDDAVYAERRADGGWFLGVYIADVSWYVREGRPLDREAYERGTSVYLVDRVIPMLPFALSNGICSLNQGEDRLAMACEMELDAKGEVTKYEIVPAVIRVFRRLTYNGVNALLEGKAEDKDGILPMISVLKDLRDARKAYRRKRGSIDFNIPEVKVKLDEAGHPMGLVKRTGSVAESIIEECMLLANETVAEHMEKKELPFIYRVHEQPNEEKIERLNQLLAAFGQHIRPNDKGEIQPMDVQKVLEKVEGRPEERIVSTVALRSMQQARYADKSLGHFGLAARYYTHFTSPIRRYPDLIVHRLLRETFATGTIPAARQDKLRGVLPEIAQRASVRERVAVDAERETTEMKEIEYMTQFVGETFPGVISGVTAFGLFVELENGVEGLVHVSRMVNDYYEYVEEQYALIGERTKKAYRLGDEVEVVLVRASVEERNIDFILKDNGVYVASDEKKGKDTPKKGVAKRGEKAASGATAKKDAKRKDADKDAAKKKSGGKWKTGVKKATAKAGVKEKADAKKAKPAKKEKKTEKPAKARRRAARAAKTDELPSRAVWPDPKPKRGK